MNESPFSDNPEIAALQMAAAHLKRQQGQIIDVMMADIEALKLRVQELEDWRERAIKRRRRMDG